MSTSPDIDEAALIELSAVKLLGGREHSRKELQRKLRARFNDTGLIDEVLDRLQQQSLLSERRFAENYVGQRCRKGYGPLRIRAELAERGVSGELITDCLDDAGIDWQEILLETAEAKFGRQAAEDRRALAKRGRFLEQRGFPISLIRRYFDHTQTF